jgi:hypothetical protein
VDSPTRCAFAVANHWLSIIIEFVEKLYHDHSGSSFLQSVDLSYLFMILTEFANPSTAPQFRAITQLGSSVLRSKQQNQAYVVLLFKLSDLGSLDFSDFLFTFMTRATSDLTPDQLYAIVVQSMLASQTESQAQIIIKNMHLLNQLEPVLATILSMMKSSGQITRLFLLKYPTVCIFTLITDKKGSVRNATWRLALAIFRSVAPPGYGTDTTGNAPALDATSRKELEVLFSQLVSFLGSQVIPKISDFYSTASSPDSLTLESFALVECV